MLRHAGAVNCDLKEFFGAVYGLFTASRYDALTPLSYRILTAHLHFAGMSTIRIKFILSVTSLAALSSGLAGCASVTVFHGYYATDPRECLARAMYFESNRSSDDGMIAVGTVVMNRLESGKYASNICGVVGQSRQFAPGVMSRPMDGVGRSRAFKNADAVLAGKRTAGLSSVQFFHTAGYNYPYNNMNYVLIAGGNAFYEKRSGGYHRSQEEVAMAQNGGGQQMADATPVPPRRPAPRPLPPVEPQDTELVDPGTDQGFDDGGTDETAIY